MEEAGLYDYVIVNNGACAAFSYQWTRAALCPAALRAATWGPVCCAAV